MSWKIDVIQQLNNDSLRGFDQLRTNGFVPDDVLREFLGNLAKFGLIWFTGEFNVGTTKRGDKIFALFLWLVKIKSYLRRADIE
jgi:hypothetical protein